jgi:nucleoid-associated protein YgaU
MAAFYNAASRYTVDDTNQSATRTAPGPSSYTTYRVIDGDTLENIAARTLGDFTRWWEIADINPHIKFPTAIKPGDVLRLPL